MVTDYIIIENIETTLRECRYYYRKYYFERMSKQHSVNSIDYFLESFETFLKIENTFLSDNIIVCPKSFKIKDALY
jgi:hypothetical protein